MIAICTASIPRKYENGYYFPGKNCGISTPIRYLIGLPENTDEVECTFVSTRIVNQGKSFIVPRVP